MAIITVIMFHVYLKFTSTVSAGWGVPPTFSWILTDSFATVFRCGVDIFLMLSGALSLGRDWKIKDFLKKRLPRIAIPFTFWVCVLTAAIILIYYFVPFHRFNYFGNFELMTLLTFFYNAVMGDTVWFTPYWFFWMILGTYLIMPIFNKWLRHASLSDVEYFLAIWFLTCLFDRTLLINIPINLTYFTGPIGMVVLGYYLRHTDRKIFNNVYYALAITIGSAIALMAISYVLSTPSKFYIFDRYSALLAIEVTGIFCLFKTFGQLNINWGFLSKDDSIFRRSVFSIAKYSYGIYLTHQFVLNLLIIFIANSFGLSLRLVILVILTLLLSWGLLAVLNRVPHMNSLIGAK